METFTPIISAIKEIGPVTAIIFLFMYITFWKILPLLREKDDDIKELNQRFIQSTDKFEQAIELFNKTLQDFKDDVADSLKDVKTEVNDLIGNVQGLTTKVEVLYKNVK